MTATTVTVFRRERLKLSSDTMTDGRRLPGSLPSGTPKSTPRPRLALPLPRPEVDEISPSNGSELLGVSVACGVDHARQRVTRVLRVEAAQGGAY